MKSDRIKILIIKFVFILIFLSIIVQLFRIQIIEGNKWQNLSENRANYINTYKATRGNILFSDGSILATSVLAYTFYLKPQNLKKQIDEKSIDKDKFVNELAEILNLEKDYIEKSIDTNLFEKIILRYTTKEKIDKINELYPSNLDIWRAEQTYKRIYPNNEIASKIVGFVRLDDNEKEIGQYGIEEYFDGILRGIDGVVEAKRGNFGQQIIVDETFFSTPPKNGANIKLTIDKNIQKIIDEKAKYWTDKVKAKETIIVAMEPNSGSILAIGNYPTYDPNRFWEGEIIDCELEYYVIHKKCFQKDIDDNLTTEEPEISEDIILPDGYEEELKRIEEEQRKLEERKRQLLEQIENQQNETENEELSDEELKILEKIPENARKNLRRESLSFGEIFRNSATDALYEPGSVIKVITVAIAYETKSISTSPFYNLGSHTGCEKVADRVLCTFNKVPRKDLTVEAMLRFSDNVGALRIAQKIPKEKYFFEWQRLKLGEKTGIESKTEPVFYPKPIDQWNEVDIATSSYGQGLIVLTPIRLVSIWNILASNGYYYSPTLVLEIDDNGKIINPEKKRIKIFEESTVIDTLYVASLATKNSITDPFIKKIYDRYNFVSKTGTANVIKENGQGYYEDRLNITQVGIAPLNNPKITLLVWFREPTIGYNEADPTSQNTAQVAWADILDGIMPLIE